MRYRVHYLAEDERRSVEVEAASPQEAVVKFRHINSEHDPRSRQGSQVVSVSAEPEPHELAW
jgi:hypothetical protein